MQSAVLWAVLATVALLGTANAYLDNGVRQHRFWPPLSSSPSTGSLVWTLNPCTFEFVDATTAGDDSDINIAVGIYKNLIFPTNTCTPESFLRAAPTLTALNVTAVAPHSQIPQLGVDESYTITIPDPSGANTVATLSAQTYIGVIRGLETFSQLVLHSAINGSSSLGYNIPEAPWSVSDKPSFPHRGLLVDPARTFIPIPLLTKIVDGLMYSKMNVLHIHLSDSQSFPLQLELHPEITQNGAVSADQTYSREDLSNLIQYASVRGVRIIPEIDTPGHSRAFGLAPTLTEIVACANTVDWTKACAEPPCGQLNPASTLMYQVLQTVLEEVATLFPETFMHVGYDEINFACWQSEPSIQAYLKQNDITVQQLLLEFFNKERAILDTVAGSKRMCFWEEAALQSPALPIRDTDVIQVWSSQSNLQNILNHTKSQIIVSWYENVYMDCGNGNMFGDDSWCDPFKTFLQMYTADPLNGFGADNRDRAIGGEAALWGETVSPVSLESRAWPRTASYGGRLWAYDNVQSKENVGLNVQAHSNRMQQRGIAASSVILPFCTLYPDLCFNYSAKTN